MKISSLRGISSHNFKQGTLTQKMLCQPETGNQFRRQCVEMSCTHCGPERLDGIIDINIQGMEKELEVKEWTMADVNRSGKTVRKKCLTHRTVTGKQLLELIKLDMARYQKHIFVANWQQKAYLQKKKNLKDGELLAVLDFSENYRCSLQDEAQSAHWNYQQVTLFPAVFNYRCQKDIVTHSVVVVSDDLTHDASAVELFTQAAVNKVKEQHKNITRFIQFTDGCAAQFKSKRPFLDVQQSKNVFGLSIERHYFGSRHGKNLSDGESAVIKSAATRAVKSRKTIIQTPREFCEFGQCMLTRNNVTYKRISFLFLLLNCKLEEPRTSTILKFYQEQGVFRS